MCGECFCRDHVTVRNGIATCEACTRAREEREASSAVSDEHEAAVVSLLGADVEATLGRGHATAIADAAAHRRLFADTPAQYIDDVVAQVQQYFHDTFVDTTWPACPHHPNHPLWCSDGWWRCERTDEPVAPLGGLKTVTAAD